MTPADRAAAILVELEESPEVAVLVAADIGNLRIAREWTRQDGSAATFGDIYAVRRRIVGDRSGFAWVEGGTRWAWGIDDRPSVNGPCSSMEDGMAQADALLRSRGWRLM